MLQNGKAIKRPLCTPVTLGLPRGPKNEEVPPGEKIRAREVLSMRPVNELSKNAITLSPTSASKRSVQDVLRGREEAGRLPGERRGVVRGDGPPSFCSPAEALPAPAESVFIATSVGAGITLNC